MSPIEETMEEINAIAEAAFEANPGISEVAIERNGIKVTLTRKVTIEEREE